MKSTSLTTPKPAAPTPITDEASAAAAIHTHCQTLESGVRLTVSGMVALGATLAHTKNVLGYSHGGVREGASSSDSNLPPKRESWPKLVARLTGKSYDWCNTLLKAAKSITDKLAKSELPTERQAAAVLSAPPAHWTADDYDGLSAVLANRFDADTFTGLLGELGLLGGDEDGGGNENPGSRLDGHRGSGGSGKPDKKPGRAEVAQVFFRSVFQTLVDSRNANPERFRERLHALPMRSPDPLKKLGLLDLKAEYQAHLAEIEAVIEAARN